MTVGNYQVRVDRYRRKEKQGLISGTFQVRRSEEEESVEDWEGITRKAAKNQESLVSLQCSNEKWVPEFGTLWVMAKETVVLTAGIFWTFNIKYPRGEI